MSSQMFPGGLRLLLGPDRIRKFQRIHELERALSVQPLDRHQLDGSTVTGAQLLALCRQQPAASARRLIVVDQAHRLDPACVEALLKFAGVIAGAACVVLLVETELSVRHPLAQAGDSLAMERFPGREAPAAKPFAFTDALGVRDVAGALAAGRDQLRAGKEPLELLGLVAWQVNRWVMVRRLLDRGDRHDRIAAVMRLAPWQAQRLQAEVSARSLGSLQRLLERCWQLDTSAKSGRALPDVALEQLVVEACLSGA